MPHTKLKVCSVLLIIYGVGDVLGVLAMLALAFVGETLGVSEMLGSLAGISGGMITLIFLLLALLYSGVAVADWMAGINGLRFCGCSCDIRLCRIPTIIVIVIQVINCVVHLLKLDLSGAMGPVVHIVIAVLCAVFAEQVEKYNLTRPPVEDMPLFNLKDDY